MKKLVSSQLKNLESVREEYWNISRQVGVFLNLLIRDRKYKTALEIGSSNGYSGIWLAEALSHHKGKLYTMESNQKKRFPLAQKNFKSSGLSKHIVQILGHAPEDIPLIPQKFDLAFFDATKHEHLSYFEVLKTRIKKGGLIITDNINSHKKELSAYRKTIEKDPNWKSVKLDIGTGLLLSFRL